MPPPGPQSQQHAPLDDSGPDTPFGQLIRRTRRIRRDSVQEYMEWRARLEKMRGRAQERLDAYIPPAVQKEAHRKGFHMVAGIVATPLVLYTGLWYTTIAALAALVVILAVEFLWARFDLAVPVLTKQMISTRRPNERFSWASVMFLVAGLLILWVAPLPVAFAALAMLGLGDGLSALVGRAIGSNKLWYNRHKSWEGSLAGFLAGAIGAMGLTAWYYAEAGLIYPLLAIVPISIAGSLAATVAESMPQWEDNFSVPIASSVTMMVLWLTAGLEPAFGPLVEFAISGEWVIP